MQLLVPSKVNIDTCSSLVSRLSPLACCRLSLTLSYSWCFLSPLFGGVVAAWAHFLQEKRKYLGEHVIGVLIQNKFKNIYKHTHISMCSHTEIATATKRDTQEHVLVHSLASPRQFFMGLPVHPDLDLQPPTHTPRIAANPVSSFNLGFEIRAKRMASKTSVSMWNFPQTMPCSREGQDGNPGDWRR